VTNRTALAGEIVIGHRRRSASFRELAGEAALLALPGIVGLSSGRRIRLRDV
jgi:hypothetical protein